MKKICLFLCKAGRRNVKKAISTVAVKVKKEFRFCLAKKERIMYNIGWNKKKGKSYG